MLIIGLTGGIGSGKTTVSKLFEKLGIPVIDTDVIARQLVDRDTPVLREIVGHFGTGILKPDGSLDRKKLAHTVFGNDREKQQLERILHPAIRSEVKRRIQALRAHNETQLHAYPYIVVVIPLLFESGYTDIVDRVLVIMADEQTRIRRIEQRDDRQLNEIKAIINSQVSDEVRSSQADDIISNNGGIAALEQQLGQYHQKYITLAATAAG